MFQNPLCVVEANKKPVWDAKCQGVLLWGTRRNCLLKGLVASETAMGDGTLKGGFEGPLEGNVRCFVWAAGRE